MHPTPLSVHRRVVVLLGPTAGGKSELAVQLAERLGGVVIGADSMQVYRHLDAGTAKPSPKLRARVPHHLIDVVEPTGRFTVHDWLTRARAVINKGLADGVTPVVVGGTNLYMKALFEGLFDGPGRDDGFRATLDDASDAELHARLAAADPDAAARIAPADRQRLSRALEVHHLTGRPISEMQVQWGPGSAKYEVRSATGGDPPAPDSSQFALRTSQFALRTFRLTWPVDAINARINLRVKAMFHPEKVDPDLAAEVCPNGESLPEEVERLVAAGLLVPGFQACEALGYKQVLAAFHAQRRPGLDDFRGDRLIHTLNDAFERTKILTRRFAKQQRTWLKRFPDAHPIDMPHDDPLAAAMKRLTAKDAESAKEGRG